MERPYLKTAEKLNELLTAAGLAELLGVSKPTLRAWHDRGLPYVRLGGRTFYHEASVAAWITSRQESREATWTA